MATVLLEIGTEEIPAGYLPAALTQLAALAQAQLQAARVPFAELRTWATPRRLVLYLTEAAEHQVPAVHEVRGPAVADAFAGNGEPTQAAIGFARSQGLAVNELRIKQLDGGEYVMAVFHDEGRPTFDLLPDIFSRLIADLTFPKTMRWSAGPVRFARPIRWIVALMDARVVPLLLDHVQAGRTTRGHRFLAPAAIEIPTASVYPRILEENLVIVDQQIRRAMIRRELTAIADEEHAEILDDGTLLDETTFSLEYPTAIRAAIDPTLLTLPDEVLLHVLRHEQRFFPLAGADSAVLPVFIAVRNGDTAFLATVREGYEGVAHAKLLDALYFYQQATQQPLAERIAALHGVIFQEHLGTMYEKARRIETLAGLFAAWSDVTPDERQGAERAALLAKADLTTALVIEHPMLRGIMGRIHARLSGEAEAVATAIGEQYLPRTAHDPIPQSRLGQILALADKLDTVVACVAIGMAPSGAEDPYGLRADARGVLRILAEAPLPLSLPDLIARVLRQLPADLTPSRDEMQATVEAFFRQVSTQGGGPAS